MWDRLSLPWKVSFEQGWHAYCWGSIPIGAVVCNEDGSILSRGRSMQYDEHASSSFHITHHPLSHAELNALLALDYQKIDPHTCKLYTIVEPCPLCVGALAMSRLKKLEYAARDPYAGSVEMLSRFQYLIEKQIQVQGPMEADFENVITAMQTAFFLESSRSGTDRVIKSWESVLPRGVALGRRILETGEINRLRKCSATAENTLEYLTSALDNL